MLLNGHTPHSASRLRAGLLTFALVSAFVLFALRVSEFYPIKHWLFWRHLKYWALCSAVACASLTSGLRVVAALGGSALSFGENLLLSFASGLLLFSLGIFVGGILGLLGPVFFFAWPALLTLLAGRAPWLTLGRAARRLLVAARTTGPTFWPRTPLEAARAALLLLGLVGIYLQVLTPDNVAFDARWYHLGIAEQYAVRGAIRPFPEGWYLGAYPQLATWLYTWAFLQPGSVFDRVALASHLEWLVFLATVPGIGLLARHILGKRVRWMGAALFLFPSLYLYDTNLSSSADHIAAFWAVPLLVGTLFALEAPSTKRVVLASLPAAGLLLTRYQAIYLLVPVSMFVLLQLARARRLALIGPAVGAMLVLTAPHWLKNLIFYGDPLYPMLHKYLPAHPLHRNAADAMLGSLVPTPFISTGSFGHRVLETLYALPTFAFVPHNWDNLDLPQPTFGSLFTLLGLALPFIPNAKRIWLLLGGCYLGVAIWYWTNHQDRFLQTLLPWMAACVVALCVRIWQLGLLPRVALSALVGLQLVWGADFYFSPNHTVFDDSILVATTKHLRAGMKHQYNDRFRHWKDFDKLNELLPRNAVVLMHNGDFRLGLERMAVTDQYGYQGAISYRELGNPSAVWRAWHDLGVTHVYWPRSENKNAGSDERARETVFREAVKRVTERRVRVPGSFLAELSTQPPP
jgi:hypothetical protein